MEFFGTLFTKTKDGAYVPNTLGVIAIIVLMVILLAIASFIIGSKKKKKTSTKQLAVSALLIAIAFMVMEFFPPLFKMPFGGTVTIFGMFFATLIGYYYGIGPGILSCVALGLLNLIIDPYVLTLPQLLVDYPLAFGALGLSGIGYHFDKKHQYGGLVIGYICGVLGRYFFAFLSGWIFFGEYAWKGWGAVSYSLAYNGAYLGAEAGITLIIILIPQIQKAVKYVKTQVN